VNVLRNRQKHNFLSQGIPMLLGGDEIGRTQRGNNNAYCQDNEISWYDWSSADTTLLEFARRLIQLRKEHPVFRRRKWFQGRPIHGAKVTDIGWFTPNGMEMAEEQWGEGFAKALGVFIADLYLPGAWKPYRTQRAGRELLDPLASPAARLRAD